MAPRAVPSILPSRPGESGVWPSLALDSLGNLQLNCSNPCPAYHEPLNCHAPRHANPDLGSLRAPRGSSPPSHLPKPEAPSGQCWLRCPRRTFPWLAGGASMGRHVAYARAS